MACAIGAYAAIIVMATVALKVIRIILPLTRYLHLLFYLVKNTMYIVSAFPRVSDLCGCLGWAWCLHCSSSSIFPSLIVCRPASFLLCCWLLIWAYALFAKQIRLSVGARSGFCGLLVIRCVKLFVLHFSALVAVCPMSSLGSIKKGHKPAPDGKCLYRSNTLMYSSLSRSVIFRCLCAWFGTPGHWENREEQAKADTESVRAKSNDQQGPGKRALLK